MGLTTTSFLGYVPGDTPPQYDARNDRQILDALVFSEGVARVNDLKVVPRSGGANLSVDIGAGIAFISGDSATRQGKYLQENDGPVNVTGFSVPGSGSVNYDIWLQVNDKQAGSSTSYSPQWVVRVSSSTPLPNAIRLAVVSVASNQSSIQAQHITDTRAFAKPMGYNTVQQYLVHSGKTDGVGFIDLPHTLGRRHTGMVAHISDQVPTDQSGITITSDQSVSKVNSIRCRVWRPTPYYVQPNANVTISYIVW